MKTALVVEDCLVERKAIEFSLHQSGFQVLTAQSGEEATRKLESHRPDIIILDVLLPGLSGFEICRQLKNDPKTNKIPIVFCSHKGNKLDKFWGLNQGADAYLTKPIVSQEIIGIIKQIINRQTSAEVQ